MRSGSGAGEATAVKDTVRDVLGVLRSGWWVVSVVSLLFGVVALGFALAQDPNFRATATLYITSGQDADSQSAYQGSLASQQRVASYAKLATADVVVRNAVEQLGSELTVGDAVDRVAASASVNTVLLSVSATGPSPEDSASLANAVARSLVNYAQVLEVPAGGGAPLARLSIVSPAEPDANPVAPRTLRLVIVSMIIGLGAGVLLVVTRSRLETRLMSIAEVDDQVGKPSLGVIPTDGDLSQEGLIDFGVGSTVTAESFRKIRTNLSYVNVDSPPKCILVSSANEGEGKTTTALNLASAVAEQGRTVVLVDADLRRPTIGKRLKLNCDVGLSDYLRGDVPISALVQPGGVNNLSVVTSGKLPPNPAELLGSERAKRGFEELTQLFDFVIVDSPPVLPVTDSAVLAEVADGVLLVVRLRKTKRQELGAALGQFESANALVLGAVINDVPVTSGRYEYSLYGSPYSSTQQLSSAE